MNPMRCVAMALVEEGVDAGARTIAYHLSERNGSDSGDLDDPPCALSTRLCYPPAQKATANQ